MSICVCSGEGHGSMWDMLQWTDIMWYWKYLLDLYQVKWAEIHDEPNKINSSEADAVKQKFHLCFNKNKAFKVRCQISSVLERETWQTWMLVTSCIRSMQEWYHVVWNIHFLNTNHSSVMCDTDLRYTTKRWPSWFTITVPHFLFEVLAISGDYFGYSWVL
jgi:hypothetical protein